MFEKSKWIWCKNLEGENTYAEFFDTFQYEGSNSKIVISADSNFTIFINGKFVNSGQYPDFPHYKVYDSIDITEYCKKGENHLAVIVWYYGTENFTYFVGNAAVKYEVYEGDKLIAYSSENTVSRKSLAYKNGYNKRITPQIGFSFCYDATKEDNWINGELNGFENSQVVDQDLQMFPRPIKKYNIEEKRDTKLIKGDGKTHFLYDIGFEEVGYLTFKVRSAKKQKITIAWGEHIVDGGVRRIIANRDFSVEVIVGEGETEYTNYFRRLGLRYLEVFAEDDIEIEYMSVLPTVYPLNKVGMSFSDPLRQKIYDVSVRTLELCMHEHYEDCPWREQALYAMDSRNQILCGYYAFKEYEFPRANLLLMSKDRREDGLLSICVPCGNPLTIPSFTLHYFTEVYEYTKYSSDLTLAKEVMPKLHSILNAFVSRIENGLIPVFSSQFHWNFYEWSDDLEGNLGKQDGSEDNLPLESALNCILIHALDLTDELSRILGEEPRYTQIADKMRKETYNTFFNKEKGLLVNRKGEERYSELVNAMAILYDVVTGKEAEKIAEILSSDHDLINATLSMVCFKYDALLKVNKAKYKDYIIDDMEKKYKMMLDAGATSFWETEDGEKAFANAGSLCHGWSGMPVYYYNTLL